MLGYGYEEDNFFISVNFRDACYLQGADTRFGILCNIAEIEVWIIDKMYNTY